MNPWTLIPISLSLILPPFLLGGVHTLAYAGMGILASLLAFYLTYRIRLRPTATRGVLTNGWFWLFLTAVAVTSFQLLPLPLSWLSTLSPATAQVLKQTLGAVGLFPKGPWQPLSLAPPETTAKLIRDLACLLLYVAVLQWSYKQERMWQLLHISTVTAAALCGLILLQTLLYIPTPLMGLYTPTTSTPSGWLLGSPFINLKHLSGYLLFHALLVLPLLANANSLRERIGWSTALGILSVTLLLTLSVYSFLLFLGGVLLFLWLLGHQVFTKSTHDPTKIDPIYDPLPILAVDPATAEPLPHKTAADALEDAKRKKRANRNYQRSSRDPKPVWRGWKIVWENVGYRIALGLGILGVGSLLLWGTQSYAPAPTNPTVDWKTSWAFAHPMIRHYPLWGAGRGATPMAWHRFASSTTPYRGQKTITHIESQWLQPFVDWGIPFGLLFVCCAIFLFWQMIHRSQGLLEHSVLLAMVALLLQNATDFNLEFLGTAFPFLVFLAALNRLQQDRATAHFHSPLLLASIAGLALVVFLWATPYARQHNYHLLPQQWKTLTKLPPKAFDAGIKRLLPQHPSDYMLAALLTRHYTFQRPWQPKRALLWSKKGLFLNPTATDIYLLRGYILARLKLYQQATRDLSISVMLNPKLTPKAVQMVFQFKFTRTAILTSQHPTLVVGLLQRWKRCRAKPLVCATLAAKAAQRYPHSIKLQEQLALLQWRQLQNCKQNVLTSTGILKTRWEQESKRWRDRLQQTLFQWRKKRQQHINLSL